MKKLVLVVFALSVATAAGCSKDKKEETTPEVAPAPAPKTAAPASDKTEVATGEVREALLALRRVHFEHDKAVLLPESRQALDEAGTRLKSYPEVEVYIDGHTDTTGTGEYNLALGEKRAQVVADYLERLGVEGTRLHAVTFGEEKPLAEGEDEAAMAKNRRAEFRLFKGDVQLILEDSETFPRGGDADDGDSVDAPQADAADAADAGAP